MVFYYAKQIDVPGFEMLIPVVAGYEDKSGKMYNTSMLLTDTSILESLQNSDEELNLIWLADDELPILTFDVESFPDEKGTNISDVMNLVNDVRKRDGEISKEILPKIVKMVAGKYGMEESKQRVKAAVLHSEYLSSDADTVLNFKIGLTGCLFSDLMVQTKTKLDQHNNKFSSVFTKMSANNNVTRFQSSCTEPFFIEIPDRNSLLMCGDEDLALTVPRRSAVCNPYDDNNAYLPNYKELGVGPYLYPAIEGKSSNNFLPIQENEQMYYDALLDWVHFNMKADFHGAEPGDVLDSLSQRYLTELADAIYTWHWSHNRNMPISSIGDDDNDDEKNESAGDASRYAFRYVEGESLDVSNALLSLNAFLSEACAVLGYKVYVEAIIKLGRWGERKPSALAFDGFDFIFDLGSNFAKRSLGDINSYTVKEVNGKQYELGGLILLGSDVADKSFGIDSFDVPVGLIANSTLVAKDGEKLETSMYVSFLDAIDMLKSGELTIDGIDVVDGELVVSIDEGRVITVKQLLDQYNDAADSFLKDPFYRSDDLKDLCMKFGASGNSQSMSMMAILDEAIRNPGLKEDFKTQAFKSTEELREKMFQCIVVAPSAALITNVTGTILPSMLEIEKEYRESEKTLKEVFALWDKLKKDYAGIDSFLNSAPVPAKEEKIEPEKTEESEATTKMTAFSQENKEEEGSEEEMANLPVLIKEIPADASFIKIVDFNGDCIGAYTKCVCELNGKQINKYTLVSKDFLADVDSSRVSEKSVCITKMMQLFVIDLYSIAACRNDSIRVYFDSIKTANHYITAVKSTMEQVTAFKQTVIQNESK